MSILSNATRLCDAAASAWIFIFSASATARIRTRSASACAGLTTSATSSCWPRSAGPLGQFSPHLQDLALSLCFGEWAGLGGLCLSLVDLGLVLGLDDRGLAGEF